MTHTVRYESWLAWAGHHTEGNQGPIRAAPQCGGGVPPGQRVDRSQESAAEAGAQEVEGALQRELLGSRIFVRGQVYR